jgi:hypothetical protein
MADVTTQTAAAMAAELSLNCPRCGKPLRYQRTSLRTGADGSPLRNALFPTGKEVHEFGCVSAQCGRQWSFGVDATALQEASPK